MNLRGFDGVTLAVVVWILSVVALAYQNQEMRALERELAFVKLPKPCALNSPTELGWKPAEEVMRPTIGELVAAGRAVWDERQGSVICTYLNADGKLVSEVAPINLLYWKSINRRTAHAQRNDHDDRRDTL